MRISTKGRYGLRALIDIAACAQDGRVTLKSVAARQGLSENYLEQIIATLKKAGFVKSVRGAGGGYSLNCDPADISVANVLRALEGPLYPVECLSDDDKTACGSVDCDSCVTRPLWEKIYASLNHILESVSLEDLLKDYQSSIS